MNCYQCKKWIIPKKDKIKVGAIKGLSFDVPFCSQKCYNKYLKKLK